MALLKALCWALIFIIRVRFPSGTSLVTVLNNPYSVRIPFSGMMTNGECTRMSMSMSYKQKSRFALRQE